MTETAVIARPRTRRRVRLVLVLFPASITTVAAGILFGPFVGVGSLRWRRTLPG